jgi:pilus assembly protein CpaB
MRRSMVSLILGVVFGVIAVALMYNYVATAGRSRVASPAIELGGIVVADKDLAYGAPVARESLKIMPWPKASIAKDAFTNIDEIYKGATGPKDRIALITMAQNEPVTRAKISGFGGKPTLSHQVENGMRAISIRVDDVVGVAGFVLPGDRVDVLLTRRMPNPADALQTQVLLQNIKVIGINQTADQAADKPILARTATVEVTPEQAQTLTLAHQAGSLSLSLRNVENADDVVINPITERDLAAGPRRAPVAARPVAAVRVAAPPDLPAAAITTVRVRYGDGIPVEKVVRP